LNVSRQPQDRVKSFLHVFDMAGAKLSVDGRDAGLRKSFVNVRGKTIHAWDGKGVHVKTTYDAMQRAKEVFVEGGGLSQVTEKFVYVDGPGGDKAHNLLRTPLPALRPGGAPNQPSL